jgi:hypothetical protein
MANTEIEVEDGLYFLHPEGGMWSAVRFRGGKLRDSMEGCEASSHSAANDSWAGVEPEESDIEVDNNTADAIVAIAMPDCDSSLVVVARPAY